MTQLVKCFRVNIRARVQILHRKMGVAECPWSRAMEAETGHPGSSLALQARLIIGEL